MQHDQRVQPAILELDPPMQVRAAAAAADANGTQGLPGFHEGASLQLHRSTAQPAVFEAALEMALDVLVASRADR